MKRYGPCRPTCSRVILATLLTLYSVVPVDSADAPPQFGNFFSTGTFNLVDYANSQYYQAHYPLFGRVNVADNNSPIPTDRVYFVYNHFHNSSYADTFDTKPSPTVEPIDRAISSANQYSLGFEKTLFDGRYSVECRLPLLTDTIASGQSADASGGNIGNLTVINKWSLYSNPTFALAAGLGISLPTGDDARFDDSTFENQSVHLQPFLGFLSAPTERSFYQGFIQVDTPLNPNAITLVNRSTNGAPVTRTASITDQPVLFLDVSVGHWLYRNRESRFLTGLAPIVELHYTTALGDARIDSGGSFDFGSRQRFDMLNVTFGLHTEFGNNTQVRVAGIVPLSDGHNNFFDAEFQFSIIRKF